MGWYVMVWYNVLRHGRNNPAVPLLILGIEPSFEKNFFWKGDLLYESALFFC